jgi:DnaJ like chaperone protein
MHYKGKLIGFLLGLWLGHWVGALFGLWIGHAYDTGLRRRQGFGFRRVPSQAEQALFFHTTFAVMGHIAKAAGRISEQQIRIASLFMDRMQLQGEIRREAQESFRQGKEPGYPLDQELVSFRRACRGQMDLLRVFLEIQLQAAFADGALQGEQRLRLLEVAELLGFSRWELEQFLAMAEAETSFGRHQQRAGAGQQGAGWTPPPPRNRLKDAYTLLGVTDDASDSEVKKAYRKQMSKHHPDKLASQGLPSEMMNMAKEKTQEIQQAWELIKQQRGLR